MIVKCKSCSKKFDGEFNNCPYCGNKKDIKVKKYGNNPISSIKNDVTHSTKRIKFNPVFEFFIIVIYIFGMVLGISSCSKSMKSNENNSISGSEIEEKTPEERLESQLKSYLLSGKSLSSINYDAESDFFTIKIKYEKDELDAYTCGQELVNFSYKLATGIADNSSVEFECVSNNETINYIGIENLMGLQDKSIIETSLVFYDSNRIKLVTSMKKLVEQKEKDYKNSCSTLKYKDVLRNPSTYIGNNAYWFGKIVQVVSNNYISSEFRVNVSCTKYSYINGYNCPDTIYVVYYGDESFIEDDMVKMWGTMAGTKSYTTVLGANVTVPEFNAKYIELQ